MKTLYCIPGLGASPAIFSRLHVKNAQTRTVQCLTPLRNESLTSYVSRLSAQIDWRQPCWLLGHSFGGILAIEIARQKSVEKVILVSSVKCRTELPWYGRAIGRLRLHRLAPLSVQKWSLPVSAYLNGVESKEDRTLLASMLAERDVTLLKWSIDQALRWQGHTVPDSLVHIHGSVDRLLPARFVTPNIRIEGGTHFMIVTRATDISLLLDQQVTPV